MIIPKVSKVKYRSTKRIKRNLFTRALRDIQLQCYEGYYSMKCDNCKIRKSCWFCGLKPVKE